MGVLPGTRAFEDYDPACEAGRLDCMPWLARYYWVMRKIADPVRVGELIDTLADAIRCDMRGIGGERVGWAIVGIRSRGDDLGRRLAEKIQIAHVGSLDITLYRDVLSEIGPQPVVRTSHIPFPIDGLQIVLVDDVLMSGRSVRAALQSLMDLGRPRRVWLSVLVDRGGRELPIRPDHVALDLSSTEVDRGLGDDERVEVFLEPTDKRDEIVVVSRATGGAGGLK